MTTRPLTPQERGAVLELLVKSAEYVWNDMPRLFARDVVEPWLVAHGWERGYEHGRPRLSYTRGDVRLVIDWTRDSVTADDEEPLHAVANVLPDIHGLCWEEIMLAMIDAAPCEARACLVANRTLEAP